MLFIAFFVEGRMLLKRKILCLCRVSRSELQSLPRMYDIHVTIFVFDQLPQLQEKKKKKDAHRGLIQTPHQASYVQDIETKYVSNDGKLFKPHCQHHPLSF